MNQKITRRVVLGTVIGGLAAGPFIIKALRGKGQQWELGRDSYLLRFRRKHQENLTFPKKFILPQDEDFLSIPEITREKIIKIHKRYWENYVKLDEAEFDYSYNMYEPNGEKRLDDIFMDAHVKLKYGYGMEIQGTTSTGKNIHWVCNMDGEATLPIAEKMNLSGMMLGFFNAGDALPESLIRYIGVYAEGVDLPENPYVQGHGKYNVIEGYKDKEMATRVAEVYSHKYYFSQKTGMLELEIRHSIPDKCNIKYQNKDIPLPHFENDYWVYEHREINGCYLPFRQEWYLAKGLKSIRKYSNVKVKAS
jgi:hypothetical protein